MHAAGMHAASQAIPLWGSPQVEIARYAGWLKKTPSTPGFTFRTRKWFELTSASLSYTASPGAGKERVLPLRDNFGAAATVEAEDGSPTFTVSFPPGAPRGSITLTADTPVQAAEWVQQVLISIAAPAAQDMAHPYVSPNISSGSSQSEKNKARTSDHTSGVESGREVPRGRDSEGRGPRDVTPWGAPAEGEAPRLTASNISGGARAEEDSTFLTDWLRSVGSAGGPYTTAASFPATPQDFDHPRFP